MNGILVVKYLAKFQALVISGSEVIVQENSRIRLKKRF